MLENTIPQDQSPDKQEEQAILTYQNAKKTLEQLDLEAQKKVKKGVTYQDKVHHTKEEQEQIEKAVKDDSKLQQQQTSEGFADIHLIKGAKSVPAHILDVDESKGIKGEFFNAKKPFFSLKIALTHAQANKVYKEALKQQAFQVSNHADPEDICPCCSQAVQGKDAQISLFKSNQEDIAHLGPTYPLYFQFMRYSMGMLAIILVVSGIYNLVENEKGNRCKMLDSQNADTSIADCTVSFITVYAGSNRELSEPDQKGSILNLVACILLILYSTLFRYRQLKLERDIDRFDTSVSDYTVFINQIPLDKRRKDIQEFIQAQLPDVKVVKIVQCFKLKEYNNLNNQLQGGSKKTKAEKDLIRKSIEAFEKQCFKEENIEQIFSGAAYVSFEREEQAIKVIEHFKISFWKKLMMNDKDMTKAFDGKHLTVISAHEPGDANWENIEIHTKEKMKRRIFTLILSLGCIAGSFFSIFFISNKQGDIRKNELDKNKVQAYTLLGSFTTIIINQVLQFLIQIFANYEAYNSKTDTIISVAKKSGIVQFINTTIVQFFVNIIQNGLDIWNSGGLVNDITLLMISNAIVPAFISILQIENIVKRVQQQLFLWKSIENQKKYTQMQVHTLFEGPQLNPAACFASAANTLLLASFYAWIIPLGLPFCIISLALQTLVNKYKLLRRQSMPVPYGAELPSEMIDFYFEIITLFYSLGCLSFELILYKNAHPCTIAQVVLALLFYFLPVNEYMDSKLSSISNFVEPLSYSEAKVLGHFSTDYDRRNPILKSEAIKKYIDFILDNEKDPVKKQYFMKVFYPDPNQTQTKTQILKLSENQQDFFFKENISKYQQIQQYGKEQLDLNPANQQEIDQQTKDNQQNIKQKVESNKVVPI